ncbi:methyltransferase family protein [Kribbella sp. NPDC050124]|uniref:methyltransferase family protein n=1 Tax=Kribbella sp. NPDC050124 TaxID=3364114 RepID=UPI00379FDAA8
MRPWRLRKRRTGWAALAAGSLVIAGSVRAATTDLAKPEALVTKGPYAISRNPMYVGWILLQLGVGLITRSGWVVATMPLVGAAIHREVVGEERGLTTKFGDEYREYRANVRRYL